MMDRTFPAVVFIALLMTSPIMQAQEMPIQPPTLIGTETYSSSAVEIFWSRSPNAVAYIVIRDGETLDTTTGISFFEEGLAPSTTYQYEILSVDAIGNQSELSSIVTVTTRGGNPETDTTRPLSLRAEVYSGTALELFWRRDTFNAPLAYEIARDGVVVGTSDGSSFFEEGLTPGTRYEYTVTLLGSNAPPASIMSTTNGGDNSAGNTGGNTNNEPVLENVRLLIYSDSAAELLWDRPATDTGITRIEVVRDTESLGRFDATSFFDDTRSPGVDHSYTLIARDNGGSEIGRVNINDNESLAPEAVEFVSPILGEFNEVDIVNLVFSAFSGQAFGNDMLRMPYHSDPTYSNAALLGGAPADAVNANVVCDNGGTAEFVPQQFAGSTDSGWEFTFNNCLDGTELIDGTLERLVSSATLVLESESGIGIDGASRTAQFVGTMSRTFDTPRGGSVERDMVGEQLHVVFTENNETFELVDANFRYVLALPFGAFMDGSFQIRSPLTQNRLLDVTITEPFEWTNDAQDTGNLGDWVAFTSGSMTITAEDGSQLQVDAGFSDNSLRINAEPSNPFNVFFPWTSFSESLPLFTPGF